MQGKPHGSASSHRRSAFVAAAESRGRFSLSGPGKITGRGWRDDGCAGASGRDFEVNGLQAGNGLVDLAPFFAIEKGPISGSAIATGF